VGERRHARDDVDEKEARAQRAGGRIEVVAALLKCSDCAATAMTAFQLQEQRLVPIVWSAASCAASSSMMRSATRSITASFTTRAATRW
jgi:hypothetical protein